MGFWNWKKETPSQPPSKPPSQQQPKLLPQEFTIGGYPVILQENLNYAATIILPDCQDSTISSYIIGSIEASLAKQGSSNSGTCDNHEKGFCWNFINEGIASNGNFLAAPTFQEIAAICADMQQVFPDRAALEAAIEGAKTHSVQQRIRYAAQTDQHAAREITREIQPYWKAIEGYCREKIQLSGEAPIITADGDFFDGLREVLRGVAQQKNK